MGVQRISALGQADSLGVLCLQVLGRRDCQSAQVCPQATGPTLRWHRTEEKQDPAQVAGWLSHPSFGRPRFWSELT